MVIVYIVLTLSIIVNVISIYLCRIFFVENESVCEEMNKLLDTITNLKSKSKFYSEMLAASVKLTYRAQEKAKKNWDKVCTLKSLIREKMQ